ncbi:hypothetical protein B0H34DRAFT_799521 [Crassisporium funariophilum]|nr:hypothetical protein B0H34DRAFT_799521 [Crassisporium funariophilum]
MLLSSVDSASSAPIGSAFHRDRRHLLAPAADRPFPMGRLADKIFAISGYFTDREVITHEADQLFTYVDNSRPYGTRSRNRPERRSSARTSHSTRQATAAPDVATASGPVRKKSRLGVGKNLVLSYVQDNSLLTNLSKVFHREVGAWDTAPAFLRAMKWTKLKAKNNFQPANFASITKDE